MCDSEGHITAPRNPPPPTYGSGTGSRGGGGWALAKRMYCTTYRTVFDVAPALGFLTLVAKSVLTFPTASGQRDGNGAVVTGICSCSFAHEKGVIHSQRLADILAFDRKR